MKLKANEVIRIISCIGKPLRPMTLSAVLQDCFDVTDTDAREFVWSLLAAGKLELDKKLRIFIP